jgi:ribosomal protein S8E
MTQMRKKRKFELGRPAANTKVSLLIGGHPLACV